MSTLKNDSDEFNVCLCCQSKINLENRFSLYYPLKTTVSWTCDLCSKTHVFGG